MINNIVILLQTDEELWARFVRSFDYEFQYLAVPVAGTTTTEGGGIMTFSNTVNNNTTTTTTTTDTSNNTDLIDLRQNDSTNKEKKVRLLVLPLNNKYTIMIILCQAGKFAFKIEVTVNAGKHAIDAKETHDLVCARLNEEVTRLLSIRLRDVPTFGQQGTGTGGSRASLSDRDRKVGGGGGGGGDWPPRYEESEKK